jgi:hypothetical protein
MVPVVCFCAGIIDVLKLERLDRPLATMVPAPNTSAARWRQSQSSRHALEVLKASDSAVARVSYEGRRWSTAAGPRSPGRSTGPEKELAASWS